MENFNVVIVGAGHHGLSVSYYLKQNGITHCVLEKGSAGNSWKNRWDSFKTNTPNKFTRLPGMIYDGNIGNGFLSRDEISNIFEEYVKRYSLPVYQNSDVESVEKIGNNYITKASSGQYTSDCVVVATGQYNVGKKPVLFNSSELNAFKIIHSSEYKNVEQLAEGGVLVIGGGQTGAQLAEEFCENGIKTYLSLSSRPSNLRRIGNADFMDIWEAAGFLHQKIVESVEYKSNSIDYLKQVRRIDFPLVSGIDRNGYGHSITLKSLHDSGVELLGRCMKIENGKIYFSNRSQMIDLCNEKSRIEAELLLNAYNSHFLPKHKLNDIPEWADFFWNIKTELNELDISSEYHFANIVLCTGYKQDYSSVKIENLFDAMGYPIGINGISKSPGLYFMGLFHLNSLSTTCLCNAGNDAKEIVKDIVDTLKLKEVLNA